MPFEDIHRNLFIYLSCFDSAKYQQIIVIAFREETELYTFHFPPPFRVWVEYGWWLIGYR